jgi:hypothetical protein
MGWFTALLITIGAAAALVALAWLAECWVRRDAEGSLEQ